MNVKKLTLIATLSALASILRIPFAVIPSLQPTTFIVSVTGYVFGIKTGVMVGVISAFVSNLFLGQGLWTIMQMIGWGFVGLIYGIIGKILPNYSKKVAIIYSIILFLCGYIFGWFMNLWVWITTSTEHTIGTFIGINIISLTFDTTHSIGNLFFVSVFGRDFIKILNRYKNKILIN